MAQQTENYRYFGNPEGLDLRGMPVRVLIVDDEELTRKLVSQVLRSVGYDVVGEATNGVEALEMFKMYKPEMVTMDVRMPQMDGISALKQLKIIDPGASVVMLTNENDKETVTQIIKAGALNYIVKPIKRQTILQKLREARISIYENQKSK
ncbi:MULTISPECIES: response regulator [unclassified Oceanispirochaeta]|uniref:response regulator n=1 Tax=unclassified Oceanispirochaeta TaxID=2635722 RepID=UPI000E093A6C|nr:MULTISPECIES: response regulator [unclassified Oceanispirochaeta]MBF9014677.1 response regulator [Oceanispirochaeta sp. M2]NPD70933.1 response regulator [Oceanispirochaeta sp. M1]RDG33767.1 response regulator [Oceanispirochaeta sp. M1]